MKIYIAGPMRGLPLFNFPAFDAAAELLRGLGLDPVNPADLDRAEGMDGSSAEMVDDEFVYGALRRDFAAICDGCVAMAFLPGWEHSEGAKAKYAIAGWIGLKKFLVDPATGVFEPMVEEVAA